MKKNLFLIFLGLIICFLLYFFIPKAFSTGATSKLNIGAWQTNGLDIGAFQLTPAAAPAARRIIFIQ